MRENASTLHDALAFLRQNCESQPQPSDASVKRYCPAVFDMLGSCWNHTLAGTIARQACVPQVGFNKEAFSEKSCLSNGSWYIDPKTGQQWANYLPCIHVTDKANTIYVFLGGYACSMVCLIISLFIFFWFKQLSCDRITLHKNLFVCFFLNAFSWSLYYGLIFDTDLVNANSAWCQLIHCAATYFATASYFWMFAEGMYLVVILLVPFNKGRTLLGVCILVGWGVPLILTVIYGIVRLLTEKPDRCWLKDSKWTYITHIPSFVVLNVNFIIILFIIRLLLTKMRSPSTPEDMLLSKTARAVFILVPLLGIQNILFLHYPTNPTWAVIHEYSLATTTSLQGVLVSVLLCFCNNEVLSLIKRRAGQHKMLIRNSSVHRRDTYTTEMMSGNCQNSPTSAFQPSEFRMSTAVV